MIGIHMPAMFPVQGGHRLLRGGEHARGFAPDEVVLAVALVPDGNDRDAEAGDELAGEELRLRLMRKAIANSKGIFFDFEGRFPTGNFS